MSKQTRKILHIVIAVLAVVNLGALLVFEYGLPSATPAIRAAQKAAAERAAKNASTPIAEASSQGEASLPEDSGTSEASSEESSALPEDFPSEAIPYDGPSITIEETDLPSLDAGNLGTLATVLADLGYLSADDGYGNDITSLVRSDYEAIEGDTSHYNATFTVTNRLGDTATETITVTVYDSSLPILELTESRITLSVGDSFQYLSYIKTARDTNGNSLNDNIEISGVVDTSRPGVYEVIYTTTSRVTRERVSAKLIVTVQ